MSYFSGKVLLGDLDDFIAPAQACSTGLFSNAPQGAGKAQLVMEDDFDEQFGSDRADVIKSSAAKVATVSLADCLACSGCVTSAETVLIQQQSTETFLQQMKLRKRSIYVAIVSKPSCVSIADRLGISIGDAYSRIESLLQSYGIDLVLPQEIGETIALVESIEEYERRKEGSTNLDDLVTKPSYAVNSDTSVYPAEGQVVDVSHLDPSIPSYHNMDYFRNPNTIPKVASNAPFITGNCPGWVCYAEKKSHALVPFLSTVRSAQQIMGQLVRKVLSNQNPSLKSNDIYLVTVVSCYDRKLEASRRDFLSSEGSQDVDCVLTSQEIFDLLQKPFPERIPTHSVPLNVDWWNQFHISSCNDVLSSSGGVLLALIHHILSQHPKAVIQKRNVRNSDFIEVDVCEGESIVFKGAFIYGFRNIQNLVMKIRRRKCNYDAVEVMACPSGCINGGGQIRPERKEEMITIADTLSCLYRREGGEFDLEKVLQSAQTIYSSLGISVGSEEAYRLFHTRYHVIPEVTVNSLNW